jgi:hypothetical protein
MTEIIDEKSNVVIKHLYMNQPGDGDGIFKLLMSQEMIPRN